MIAARQAAKIAWVALLAIAPAYGQSSDFGTIKAAAAKEGTLVVWHNTPKQETTDALAELFAKRFGIKIKVERVATNGGDMTSRLMAEKRGGKVTIDVFIATDRQLPMLVKNGLVDKVDWVGLFAGPGKIDAGLLTHAAERVFHEYQGYGLKLRHSVFG